MVIIENSALDDELKNIDEEPKEEENKENQDLIIQNNNSLDDFKPYINYFHKLIFNSFKLDVNPVLIDELDDNLIKILNKRVPNIANLAGNSPEIAYLSVVSLIVMTSKKEEKKEEPIIQEGVLKDDK